jgi:soluble lytic murein transglycosylase
MRRKVILGLLAGLVLLAVALPVARRLFYPLLYKQELLSVSQEFQLDPALVAAVVLCESRFDPEAESSVGARGLMQIMPDTASWMAKKLDMEGPIDLTDPVTNLRIGCGYLSWLMQRYDHNVKKTMAAYHAGQSRVDGWLEQGEYSADGKTLDNIPIPATHSYVDKVESAYENYRRFYRWP